VNEVTKIVPFKHTQNMPNMENEFGIAVTAKKIRFRGEIGQVE
jgi:hypothetical protein